MSASTEPTEGPSSGDFVQSLARGLLVIRALDAEHPELSLSEVARRADIPPAATRFTATATSMGRVLLASLPDAERDAALRQSELTALTDHTLTSTTDLLREHHLPLLLAAASRIEADLRLL